MPIRPMLAYTPKDLDEVKFPVLASPKLDGVRALNVNGQLLSRKLKPIRNRTVYERLALTGLHGLDGELVAGSATEGNVFHRTTSAVMTEGGSPQVTFWVFDRHNLFQESFLERIRHLPQAMHMGDGIFIQPLKHRILRTRKELDAYEETCLTLGYEGVMLRDPKGLYKFGRSGKTDKWLMKVKRFQDAEAEIIGIVEQMNNQNEAKINELGYLKRSSHKANRVPKGTTGALMCRLPSGVEFEIGTGMDDALRLEFWKNPPIGKTAKFKFQPVGIKDKPRFPVFLGIRED